MFSHMENKPLTKLHPLGVVQRKVIEIIGKFFRLNSIPLLIAEQSATATEDYGTSSPPKCFLLLQTFTPINLVLTN